MNTLHCLATILHRGLIALILLTVSAFADEAIPSKVVLHLGKRANEAAAK